MKKILLSFFLSWCFGSHAFEFSVDRLVYSTDGAAAGECRLIGVVEGSDFSGECLVIPEIIKTGDDTYIVTSIASHAFSGQDVAAVEIPVGVKSIGGWVFSGCRRLKEVGLPSGLEVIGDYCFQDNVSLSAVNIPASVMEIGQGVFRGCSSLDEVEFKTPITDLPDYFFYDCVSLKSLSFTSDIREVGEHCFNNCVSLNDFDFSAMARIGERAFSGCKGLERVVLKSSLADVSDGAFEHCEGLKTLVLAPNIMTVGELAFDGCSQLKELEIGNSTSYIGSGAFANCNSLREIYVVNEVPPSITVTSFPRRAYLSATLFVSRNSKIQFSQSPYWDNFSNIIGVDEFPLEVQDVSQEKVRINLEGGRLTIMGSGYVKVTSIDGVMIFQGMIDQYKEIDMTDDSLPIIVNAEGKNIKVM
ncbi:MAG: leucine-rich repeat domain-containing protein [Bacteroidales bacterium]|nr:leucine-rich repeat domain-containing protein [Bacteroidales bacterium]